MKKIFLLMFMTFFLLMLSNMQVGAEGWGFQRNSLHQPPNIGNYQNIIEGTNTYFVGSNQKVYLTFDAGYDNGNLEIILDTLKEKNVQASFFVTGDFVMRFSDLTKRMVWEGHIVANHSYSHRSINSLSRLELCQDLEKLEKLYEEVTGEKMLKIFRPPKGEFDRQSLLTLKELGYKNVFWSIAFKDWDTNQQLGKEYSYNSVINNLHNGAIILLHSVSKSNVEALPLIIEEITNQGYKFGNVSEF